MAESITRCEASVPHLASDVDLGTSIISSQTPSADFTAPALPQTHTEELSGVSTSTLEAVLAAFSIDSDRDEMFRSLATVFRKVIAQENCIDLQNDELQVFGEALRRGDASESHGIQDFETLELTKMILEQMLQKHSMYMIDAAEILARASRNPAWRGPFGETGFLSFFLRVLVTRNARTKLLDYALRLVGNTCAENDTNRQRVVECKGIEPIMRHLDNDDLFELAVPVLYNICVDFAQSMALEVGIFPRLLNVLDVHMRLLIPVLSYLCRLIDLFASTVDVNASPANAVEILFRHALSEDLDISDSSLLVHAAAAHLKAEQYQRRLSKIDGLNLPLVWLAQSYSMQQTEEAILQIEEEVDLAPLRAMIILSLSNISALPTFTAKYSSLNSPIIDTLAQWLITGHAQLQSCACIMLGNLARSDVVCQKMISSKYIHLDLLGLLHSSSDNEALHAAFGFLQNLALLNENRIIMGNAGTIPATARFWTTTTAPQIAYAALRFLRRIISGCLSNISELMTSVTPDPESPAFFKTYLSLLQRFFSESDDMTVKIEVSRIIAAILRTMYSLDSLTSLSQQETVLLRLYHLHPNIAEPLGMMTVQSQWPILSSEGWFAMALMARTKEGCLALGRVLQKVDVFGALQAAIQGQPSLSASQSSSSDNQPVQGEEIKQQDEMKAKNRDNARILVSELLKHEDSEARSPLGTMLEKLLHATV